MYQLYNLLEVQGISVARYASGAIRQLYIRSSDLVVYVVVYVFLFSEKRLLLNMPESTMLVPSEAVPAIIGCEGSKIKDTCAVFNTSIDIDKTDDPLSYVTIRGDSEVAIEKANRYCPWLSSITGPQYRYCQQTTTFP